jgi:hypothetical protein
MRSSLVFLFIAVAFVIAVPKRAAAACTPAASGVTVCSPHTGLSTSSPVHYVAAASTSCSKGIGFDRDLQCPGQSCLSRPQFHAGYLSPSEEWHVHHDRAGVGQLRWVVKDKRLRHGERHGSTDVPVQQFANPCESLRDYS